MASSAYNFDPLIAETAAEQPGVSVTTLDSQKKQEPWPVMKENPKELTTIRLTTVTV